MLTWIDTLSQDARAKAKAKNKPARAKLSRLLSSEDLEVTCVLYPAVTVCLGYARSEYQHQWSTHLTD